MHGQVRRSISLSLSLLVGGAAVAAERTDGPQEVAAEPAAAAAAAPAKKPAQPPAPASARPAAASSAPAKKSPLSVLPAKAEAAPPKSIPAATIARQAPLKLAPSASEIEKERRAPEGSVQPRPKEKDPRDATPQQDPRWPTHVDYTRGPGSPIGGNTAGDRKATLQEVSGPQQGVIRNRW